MIKQRILLQGGNQEPSEPGLKSETEKLNIASNDNLLSFLGVTDSGPAVLAAPEQVHNGVTLVQKTPTSKFEAIRPDYSKESGKGKEDQRTKSLDIGLKEGDDYDDRATRLQMLAKKKQFRANSG